MHLHLLTWVNSSGNAWLERHFGADIRLKTHSSCLDTEQRLFVKSHVSTPQQRNAMTTISPWHQTATWQRWKEQIWTNKVIFSSCFGLSSTFDYCLNRTGSSSCDSIGDGKSAKRRIAAPCRPGGVKPGKTKPKETRGKKEKKNPKLCTLALFLLKDYCWEKKAWASVEFAFVYSPIICKQSTCFHSTNKTQHLYIHKLQKHKSNFTSYRLKNGHILFPSIVGVYLVELTTLLLFFKEYNIRSTGILFSPQVTHYFCFNYKSQIVDPLRYIKRKAGADLRSTNSSQSEESGFCLPSSIMGRMTLKLKPREWQRVTGTEKWCSDGVELLACNDKVTVGKQKKRQSIPAYGTFLNVICECNEWVYEPWGGGHSYSASLAKGRLTGCLCPLLHEEPACVNLWPCQLF